MSKINVVLKAVLDDGRQARLPGETVSMDEDQAKKLASLGMVRLPKVVAAEGENTGKASKGKGKKTPAKDKETPPLTTDDGGGDGGEDEGDPNGSGNPDHEQD